MKLTENRDGNNIEIMVEGREDTTTSASLQQAILVAFQKCSQVALNVEKVDYISSAGLRALLIGQKTANSKGGNMTLRKVQPAVMEVLKMSGFSTILQIE